MMHHSFRRIWSRLVRTLPLAAALVLLPLTSADAKTACGGQSCKEVLISHLEAKRDALRAAGRSCSFSNGMVRGSPPQPEVVLDTRKQGHSPASLEMSAFMVQNAHAYFFGGNKAAGSKAISALVSWANADAHTRTASQFKGSAERWPSYGLMTSVLNSLFLLDAHPDMTQERREAIYAWVERTMRKGWIFGQLPSGGAGLDDREQRMNNHNARRSLVLLYWGILTDDSGAIRKAENDLRRTIKAIRPDGSMFDANRGDWALRYTNFALDSTVLHISLLNIVKPGSLRKADVEDIDRAISFLFREARSPSKIHEYASQNVGRGGGEYSGRQDNDWMTRPFDGGMIWWAWIDSPIVRSTMPKGYGTAKAALQRTSLWGRLKVSETGGAVSCWF